MPPDSIDLTGRTGQGALAGGGFRHSQTRSPLCAVAARLNPTCQDGGTLMPHLSLRRLFHVLLVSLLLTPLVAEAQTTAFTYQGKLSDGGSPANGTYDLQFKLFDTAAVGTGTQQGPTLTYPTVTASA